MTDPNRAAVPSGPVPKDPPEGRSGPCLSCGTFTDVLLTGRDDGYAVYCADCVAEVKDPR